MSRILVEQRRSLMSLFIYSRGKLFWAPRAAWERPATGSSTPLEKRRLWTGFTISIRFSVWLRYYYVWLIFGEFKVSLVNSNSLTEQYTKSQGMILIHFLSRKVGNEKPDPAPVPAQWGTGFPSFNFKKFVEHIKREEVNNHAVSQTELFSFFGNKTHWIRILVLQKPGSGFRIQILPRNILYRMLYNAVT